ncbi:DUF3320 domain-containing protein [Mangrovibacterium marinum]|uniref:DUF3320 domain-containing protein n=1 Tax=Mangrovibacterium marinum TaxID=1639118 RepID=UPI001B8690CC|nr:DUF3320 domain-containing protein [Mangrovibacterium marinum]
MVRQFFIENTAEDDLAEVDIEISCEPEFAGRWQHHLDVVQAGQTIKIDTENFRLSSTFLSELTEKVSGEINLTVAVKGAEVFCGKYPVEVLAYDQWNGIGVLPEMLAAFVTPNHPEIATVLSAASGILNQWTGDPSFDAYQSLSPDRVKKQMAAIYEAIAGLGVVYCSPPASFENAGQRVRMCDTIFSQKLGTCLDMALLYAGCLEAIGLHPLIVVIDGHAFVGSWLVENTFPDRVNDDVALLKKRIASGINEIGLVESTCMNAGKNVTFDEANDRANYHLVDEDNFILFIDVARARFSGIRPLPQRIKTSDGWQIVETQVQQRDHLAPEEIIGGTLTVPNDTPDITKQKIWERKLLDLSLRNNLLNLRVTQSTIQLISVSLGLFEDALADGDEFQVLSKPRDWSNPLSVSGVYQSLNMSDPIVPLLKDDLKQKRLRSYLTESELASAMTKLYRSSRLSLEENGANTLYLALGFLKWYESDRSEVARYAPLLLLPVEIVRKSAQKGYVIRSREEDTLMNITLLEMLRQDFGIAINGLEELPKDDSGVDVQKIFNIVRHGIMSQARWDVEEQAFLGTFSFSKFIMWNDIHNNAEKLAENKIVASLISGKLEWQVSELTEEAFDFDHSHRPSDIALPINADSSQLEAICSAVQDKSFILHGPPGTGKSQTITNIIANALYKGKRVLFVAEKMAALSVVQKRLADIGLDPFCLELHSNKAKKSTVLEQLQKAVEVVKKTSPFEYQSEAERLFSLRVELNAYVESLHKPYSFGLSLYDCFSGYASLNGAPDCIKFEEQFLQGLNKEKIGEYTDLVEELQNAGILCGHPFKHALAELKIASYSSSLKSQSQELITKYIECLQEYQVKRDALCTKIKLDIPEKDKTTDLLLLQLAKQLLQMEDTPGSMFNVSSVVQTLSKAIELSEHGAKRDEARTYLLDLFRKEILQYDADQSLDRWKAAAEKWALPKWLEQGKIRKSLKKLSKANKVGKEQVAGYLDQIIRYRKEQDLLDQNTSFLSEIGDFIWNNGNCDWKKLVETCEAVIRIHQLLTEITRDPLAPKAIRSWLGTQFAEGAQTFRAIHGGVLKSYIQVLDAILSTEQELASLLQIDFSLPKEPAGAWTGKWRENATNWLTNLDSLKDWASWNLTAERLRNARLSPVVEQYLSGSLKTEEVVHSFKKAIYRLGAEAIIQADPGLASFNGKFFETKIQKYKEKIKYFEELTKAELYAKLASNIPSLAQSASQSSEMGILQRAIRNKGRGLSLRKLFDLLPNLLPRMCPCMLMSPISVAQYFDLEQSKFDLVVFDEASQMPTCEAVGAIARGNNVVVVGDPKQMPPTSFFSTNRYDEDNLDKEDLESILDDCLALSIPSKHLLWHYRSKHESLIAFSNSNYYDNKLMTFPSPDDLTSKVNNVHVEGFYDRGKTRQNKFEAVAIVDEVIRRLSDPLLSKRSIGIVTFSSVQQTLIEDLLNEELKNHPELDAIAMESQEPIFVKNLENVQGDERDVILFSMGYGKDKEGKLYYNFGPLNREGGWRRLNVAVSRARYEMKVYSTLRSDEIDISKTTTEGVMGIKAFLEYSEKGKIALTQKNYSRNADSASFAKVVADEIKKSGYTVHTEIGCSGYRIDLGIVNPQNPTEYMLGILTDGENYKSAKTAKDREVVRTDVLRLLGWNIYKLWSPDWWDNPDRVLQDILKAIHDVEQNKYENSDPAPAANKASEPGNTEHEEIAGVKLQGITQEVIVETVSHPVYQQCTLATSCLTSSDEFFDPKNLKKITTQIKSIVETEGPISHTLLSRRILNAWGISRLGVRLNEFLTGIYERLELKKTPQNESWFYWPDAQEPAAYSVFRVPRNDDEKRNADDLPKEEIAAGVHEILTNQISLPIDDLVKEVAHLFGYARIGANVDQAMRLGIEYALKQNLIVEANDRIVLI